MANLFDVQISGSGELGEISSLSVNESGATASSPTDNPGAVGTLTLTGRTEETSIFLADNPVSLSVRGLGTTPGKIDTVSIGHATTTVSGPNALSRFVTGNVNVPAVKTGDPTGALDLAMQLSGEVRGSNQYRDAGGNPVTSDNSRFYTMNGHDAGFNPRGQLVIPVDVSNSWSPTTGPGNLSYPEAFPPSLATPWISSTTGRVYSKGVDAFYLRPFLALPTPEEKSLLSFYWPIDSGTETVISTLGTKDFDVGPGQLTVTLNPSAHTAYMEYFSIVSGTGTSVTLDTSSISGDEWVVTLAANYDITNALLTMHLSVSDTLGSSVVSDDFSVTTLPNFPTFRYDTDGTSGSFTMRMIRYDTVPDDWQDWDLPYEMPSSAVTTLSPMIYADPIQNYYGPVWTYLNQVCAGSQTEIALVNGVVTQRSLRTETLDINNIGSDYRLTPNSNTAEKVTLEWVSALTPPPAGPSLITTPAAFTFVPDQIIGVSSGETTEVFLQTPHSFSFVRQSVPVDYSTWFSSTSVNPIYVISGADKLPIPAQQWVDAGGSVFIEATEVSGELRVVLSGPARDLPDAPGPYTLSLSSGETEYPALKIQFWGVGFSDYQQTTISTGASPSPTTQIEPVTFRNVWATSKDRIWGVLNRAAKRYSGPVLGMNLTIPTADANGFGLCEGSVFRFRNTVFRVISATFNVGTTVLRAEPTSTYAQFEYEWSGGDYGDFESLWSPNYSYADFSLTPLTTEW